jgi:hypothetical protein
MIGDSTGRRRVMRLEVSRLLRPEQQAELLVTGSHAHQHQRPIAVGANARPEIGGLDHRKRITGQVIDEEE